MKKCDCEHWQTCPVCYPQGFNTDGSRKTVEIHPTREDLQATIAQQAEQLAAAERDAERYRWLRSNHPIHDNSPFICRNFGAAFSQWTGDQADKAIDAAIAASREGKS